MRLPPPSPQRVSRALTESWGPYKWLWTHLVLARDEGGNPAPYTHGVRRNWRVWLPIMVLLLAVVSLYFCWRWWRVLIVTALGALLGHFFW